MSFPRSWPGCPCRTHCAGTLSAVASNRKGILGVAPRTRVVCLKVLRSNGGGSYSAVIGESWVQAAACGGRCSGFSGEGAEGVQV